MLKRSYCVHLQGVACFGQDGIMQQDMKYVTKYGPWTELPFSQSRINNYANSTGNEHDWQEHDLLKVAQKVNQFLSIERNELLVLDPDVLSHL